jgi:sensor histidine kinase YesM
MFDYLQIQLYTKAHKIARVVIIPATIVILFIISFLFFYESEQLNLRSVFLTWLYNVVSFLIFYLVVSPYIFKHKSIKTIAISLSLFVILTPLVYHYSFKYHLLIYPAAILEMNPPLTLLLAVYLIIAVGVHLTSLCLYLILNHFLLSRESYELLTKTYQEEINALRLQMNPHFISNALNNLNSIIRSEDKEKALAYTTEIKELVGEQLKYATEDAIKIQEELSWLEYYLQVEQQRLANSFDYTINIPDDSVYLLNIPPMLLQPLVENSIGHGFNTAIFTGKGQLTIDIKKIDAGLVSVVVSDNGVGTKALTGNHKNRKSIALDNIEKRIQLINEIGDFYIIMNKKADTTGTTIELQIKAINVS